MDKYTAYLVGLMCGRGHIISKYRKIVIEFAHKNKVIQGIAYCPRCNSLATKNEDSESENLTCKDCGREVLSSVKKVYEQRESTIRSINEEIIPFLTKKFKVEYDLIGNDHMTLLILAFSKNISQFNNISKIFKGRVSFDSFEIPPEVSKSKKESKIEFLNGLLDTSGFFNSGSWYMRQDENGKKIYIMRGYFQIVRNWKMPIQICDFLYKEFSLTIQTIDWGHPNMRDQANIYAWAREHQVKFFPEEYSIFKPKIKHKQEMFKELRDHNQKQGSYKKDIYGISSINFGQIKPYHPAENDIRLPSEIRGKHFDASWQISLELGSKYISQFFKKAKNKKISYLTGEDKEADYDKLHLLYSEIRKEKTVKVEESRKKVEEKINLSEEKKIRTNSERMLYHPICSWLEKYFSLKYGEKIKFYDTSSFYLNKFILANSFYHEFESYDEYKIKPDLVGFLLNSKKVLITEVKIGELTIKDLGQLRGYCLVADPEFALLISKKEPSIILKKMLKVNKKILSYGNNKEIKIGVWNGNKTNFMEI